MRKYVTKITNWITDDHSSAFFPTEAEPLVLLYVWTVVILS